MTVIKGDLGSIHNPDTPAEFSSITGYTVNENRETQEYKASNTAGATGRLKGLYGWGGTYAALGAIPEALPRDIRNVKFYLGPDSGVIEGVGTVLQGQIIVDSVDITWNWEDQIPVRHNVNFTGIGLITYLEDEDPNPGIIGDAADLIDRTSVNLVDVCPTKIEVALAITPVFETLTDITSAVLTLTANNTQNANSSTNCAQTSIPGGIDWSLAVNRQQSSFFIDPPADTVFSQSGDDYQVRIYTDASLFWLLKFGILKDHTNIQGSIEDSNIVGYTMNYQMQAFDAAGQPGQILLPSSTEWWPTDGRTP